MKTRNIYRPSWANLLFASSLLLSSACMDATFSGNPNVVTPHASPSLIGPDSFPNGSPVKIVVAVDFSGSAPNNRIQRPSADDLQPLFELLLEFGGELAILMICDYSDRPLLRARIPEPPQIPFDNLNETIPPTPPATTGNPFKLAEQQTDYEEKLRVYREKQAENQQVLAVFEDDLARHQEAAGLILEAFHLDLVELLESRKVCQTTDIWGSVQRADLFLAEPTTAWSSPPSQYAVFITDGLDTVGQTSASFTSEVQLLLVNGTASLGIFTKLPHHKFESTGSALEHLVAEHIKKEIKNES